MRLGWGGAAAALLTVGLAGGGTLVVDRQQRDARRQLDSLRERLDGQQARAAELRQELDTSRAQLVDATFERDGLERGLGEARLRAGRLASDVAALRSQVAIREEMADEAGQALALATQEVQTLQAERDRLAKAEAELQDALRHARRVADESGVRVAELEAEQAAAGQTIEQLNRVLSERQTRLDELAQAVDAGRRELGRLRQELTAATGAAERQELLLQDLERALIAERQRTESLSRERERLAAQADLVTKLRANGVNVERLAGVRPLPKLSSLVLRVDERALPPKVLVNAGRAAGLAVADRLFVVRQGRTIGELEVDQVDGQVTTSRLVRGDPRFPVRPGDQVLSKRPD